jgi:hypothetical protein
MGFEDYVAKKYPGIVPRERNRAWEVWDEPPPQLPQTVVAFKLCFPEMELAVRPDQRKSKQWQKEILYVDLRKRLPPGWMTVVTLFVTIGDVHLRHEPEPSVCFGSLDMGDGRRAKLIAHGDPEGNIYELIGGTIAQITAQAQQKGLALPEAGFAYMLGKSDEGHRLVVSPTVARAVGNAILQTLDKLDTFDFVSQTVPKSPTP